MTGGEDGRRHELVLTGDARTNSRFLLVRCRCMAPYDDTGKTVHGTRYSRRFYEYDWLGRVPIGELERALEIYREHVRASAGSLGP